MLSKVIIKQITSLRKKKYRDQLNLLCAEGSKVVTELLDSGMKATFLIYTPQWEHPKKSYYLSKAKHAIETDSRYIKKISNLKTPSFVFGVFEIEKPGFDKEIVKNSLSLLLDDIQDPGNLGTIIRIADWFDIRNIFCSQNTVDAYNPKVIQASAGTISRVKIHYTSLKELIAKFHNSEFPVYGTFLEGNHIYKQKLSSQGFIVMGNEGKGISPELEDVITQKLFIPSYPGNQFASESLNVSIATAIVCSEFRRRC